MVRTGVVNLDRIFLSSTSCRRFVVVGIHQFGSGRMFVVHEKRNHKKANVISIGIGIGIGIDIRIGIHIGIGIRIGI
ncbi:hypothetical protein Tco_1119509, partial [Tanacetum coccineum]